MRGRAPFAPIVLAQPVGGAARGAQPDSWRGGKLCDVSLPPFNAIGDGVGNSTSAIQAAIDSCGDLASGGTVLLPAGVFLSASLFLRSNLTLSVQPQATLLATSLKADAPLVYTRREGAMMMAHAGLLNAGRCIRMQEQLVGGDGCTEWRKLHNVVIEGGGTLDADGHRWHCEEGRRR